MNISKIIFFAPLVSILLSSCVNHQQIAASRPVSVDNLQQAYEQAVAAAKYPDAEKISRDLVPLLKSTPGLVFNEQGQVLMTTFTKAAYYEDYQQGRKFNLYGESWFTAAPFVQNFCREYTGTDLLLRMQQLLGLPPTPSKKANDSVASIWIKPSELFRPCADPEVSDGECVVNLSGQAFVDGQTSWAADTEQVSASFANVKPEHLKWMVNNWNARYHPSRGQAYPWTALGYTYDWANPNDPVGMSEFVGLKDTPVVFVAIVPLDAYCGR
jgi:hypothetical protein